MTKPAILALADGSIFRGESIGADGQTVGEVVFNTAMTGYQEILTDPSYAQQIVTLTYPHIGNTGTTPEDAESNRVWASGLVIRDLPLLSSSWRDKQPLDEYLKENNVVAIADIDTRRLTRILREKGSQNGCILAGDDISEEKALELARSFPGLKGMDLAKEVTCDAPYEWRSSVWNLETDSHPEIAASELPYHVVAYDFGVKLNILRMLVARGCRLTVVPAKTPAADVLALNPDGVFLS
ncbi:MAG: carbamoyl phosphate synthase small subunit, partial [Pseudomonas sp.]